MNERPKDRSTEKDHQEQEREKRIKEHGEALKQVVHDLRNIGYDIHSVDGLRHSGEKYDAAIPVLLYWLPRVPLPHAKESIVRALSVPWAKSMAGPILIEEFEKAPKDANLFQWHALRWTIGNALEVIAEPSLLNKLIEIVTNKENGKAREMFVLALAKIRDPRSIQTLIKLLDDEQVAGHAVVALRKLKATQALEHLARFTDHPQAWVRKEAKKAIAVIMKASSPDR